MKVVRGRAEARWIPSRYTFALFRLYGLLKLRKASPEPADTAYVLDPHQNATENFTVGGWVLLTMAAFVASILQRWMVLPAALLVAPVLAVLLVHAPIVVVGLIRFGRENLRVNSVVLMTIMAAAAAYFAQSRAWVRFAAWQFLLVLLINGAASALSLLLRKRIEEAERSLGGFSSDL